MPAGNEPSNSDMKKRLHHLLVMMLLGCSPILSFSQADLFDGLFEKEAPRFFVQAEPTVVPGEVRVIYHFTHSKASTVEASLWSDDLGTNLRNTGKRTLVRSLHNMGNRQRDTVYLTGLTPQHVYNIGFDYRLSSALNRKFSTVIARQDFRYEGPAAETAPLQSRLAKTSSPATQPKPQQALTAKSPNAVLPSPPKAPEIPCKNPELKLQVDPAGYCGSMNRPAVLLSCTNCQGTPWDFIVEVRMGNGPWAPTRVDGRPQAALGTAPRTEPLCMLAEGAYQLRVLAWGQGCDLPVEKILGTSVRIGQPTDEGQSAQAGGPFQPSPYRQSPAEAVKVPELCGVTGRAQLTGNTIRGHLSLPLNSACAPLNAYAELTYTNPGYRDINFGQIKLYPGMEMPFEVDLDERDMQRGIHTLKATVFIPKPGLPRPIPAETFYIRAFAEEASATAQRQPVIPGLEDRMANAPKDYNEPQAPMQGTISSRGIERNEDNLYIDEALLREDAATINVTATDPNCTQIQDLQLVYSPTQPDRPLYISWLSPRCCQEAGCKYTVWAGPDPDKLSLVVTGQKAGAQVSELLQNMPARYNYFEVVVETTNGARKAAYIPAQGPIYGIEDVLAYRDRFSPQYSDPIKGQRIASGSTTASNTPPASDMPNEALEPKLPIDQFKPCRYQRKTTLAAEQPIQSGETVTIAYDFNEPGHQFTLYHQASGSTAWTIAPGTKELQSSPEFELKARDYHSGKYLILVYKAASNWGCLSAPFSSPLELNVVR